MNTKLNFVTIVVAALLIATACSSNANTSPILDQAQPERSLKSLPSVPVTGERSNVAAQNVYDFEQGARAYPSQQLHSACASENIQHQARCEEKEQMDATFFSGNTHPEEPAHPSQKLHSACVSEDIGRQANCAE